MSVMLHEGAVLLAGGAVATSEDCCCDPCPHPWGCMDVLADNYDSSANSQIDSECQYTTQLVASATVDIDVTGWVECPPQDNRRVDFTGSLTETVAFAVYETRYETYSSDCPPTVFQTSYDGTPLVHADLDFDGGDATCNESCPTQWTLHPQYIQLTYDGNQQWDLRVGDPITVSIDNGCFDECIDEAEQSDCDVSILAGALGPLEVTIGSADLVGVHNYNFTDDLISGGTQYNHFEIDLTVTFTAPPP